MRSALHALHPHMNALRDPWQDSGGAPFSPLTPGNLNLWLDANLGVTQVAGRVSQWSDQSGLGHHLTQASSTPQPQYFATGNGVGGPFLQGNKTNQWMSGAWALVQPCEVFVVAKWNPTAGSNWDLFDGSSGNTMRSYVDGGGSLHMLSTGSNDITSPPSQALNSWLVYDYQFNGASSALLLSGTDVISGNHNAGNGTTNGLTLWAFGAGLADWSDAQIVSVIIYSAILSSPNRTALSAYLRARWAAT